jgi:hypothetical protein
MAGWDLASPPLTLKPVEKKGYDFEVVFDSKWLGFIGTIWWGLMAKNVHDLGRCHVAALYKRLERSCPSGKR